MTKQKADFLCDSVGSTLTLHIRGEIDHHTAGRVRSDMDALLFERRPARLFLNLSAVTFMDSSGLGLIMGRFSVMKELGGELIVCDPSPEIRGILTLAGMERLVRIEYSPRAAAAGPAAAETATASASAGGASARVNGMGTATGVADSSSAECRRSSNRATSGRTASNRGTSRSGRGSGTRPLKKTEPSA